MIRKKIICLFPRFYIGGVSKALSFVANTCDNSGMEVHCISMTSQPETVYLNSRIKRYTIDTEKDSPLKTFLSKFIFLFRFRHLVSKIKPDLIIAFRPDLAKAVQYSLIGKQVPLIGSERGNPMIHGDRLKQYRKVFEKCTAVVFQTEAAREVYDISVKTAIIPNPAVSRINGDKDNIIRSGRNLISVSRLSSEKNIEGLLRAFAMARDKLDGRKLFLYGDGPQQKELEKIALDLQIEKDVVFAGNVKDFTVQKDNASVFVLNTLSEGMPNALIEAMLAGYACICTDCPVGAPRWLSDNERRVKLVPVKDDYALSQAMLDVALDKEKAETLATNALEIKDLLNPERIGNMWLKLINEIINERNH